MKSYLLPLLSDDLETKLVFFVHWVPGTITFTLNQKPRPKHLKCCFSNISVYFGFYVPGTDDRHSQFKFVRPV